MTDDKRNRKTRYNSAFAIGGVYCTSDSLMAAESFGLRTNNCAEKLAHRQSAKRYLQDKQPHNPELEKVCGTLSTNEFYPASY